MVTRGTVRSVPERIELAPNPENVAAARRWGAARAVEAGCHDAADTVALLVSELVTNVVLHARTPFELSFRCRNRRLRFEVRDHSDRLPVTPTHPDSMALSGRGMGMVSMLSDAYGAEDLPSGGKVVWFELEAPVGSAG